MNCEYTCEKPKFSKEKVEELQVIFDNGERITLRGSEIQALELRLYDRLVRKDNFLSPIVESGYIKLKPDNIYRGEPYFGADQKRIRRERVETITERLLRGGIQYIILSDANNWSFTLLGDATASAEEELVTIRYMPNSIYGSAGSQRHTVTLPPVKKAMIRKIYLDFENCDGFETMGAEYGDEIAEVNLRFSEELVFMGSGFVREVIGGCMRLRLNREVTWRRDSLYGRRRLLPLRKYRRRLLWRGNEEETDLCNLYITYGTYMASLEEMITLKALHEDNEENDGIAQNETKECDAYKETPYVSGVARKRKGGEILIVFGKGKE